MWFGRGRGREKARVSKVKKSDFEDETHFPARQDSPMWDLGLRDGHLGSQQCQVSVPRTTSVWALEVGDTIGGQKE